MNKKKNNAILICHALTGDQFCTGKNPITKKNGWWHLLVGPGKVIDTNILKTQERIERILGLKVNIFNKKNNSGKITIEYKDLDQFELISDLLTKN